MKKVVIFCFVAMISAVSLFAAASNVQFPVRGAFYYAWYPQTWTVNSKHVFYHPTLGYYESGKTNVVDAHIQALDYAKIDVAIISWWGPKKQYEDTRVPLLLNRTVTKGSGLKWAFYYEQAGFPAEYDLSVSNIQANLNYLAKYTNHAACAKIDGKPVMFVYNVDSSTVASNWKKASNGKWYVVLKVFPGYKDVPAENQPDGWHQYGPASAAVDSVDSYSISPGFWRADKSAAVLSRSTNRWAGNVRDMVASGKKWQLVTTFNEWGEGTAVESANEWQSSSGYGHYLDLLHNAVMATNGAAFVSQVVPASMVAGQTTNVTIKMKNTGTSTWSPAEAQKLGSLNDSTNWGMNRVYLTGSVAPNQTNTFTFSIKAPPVAGSYAFQWRMVDDAGSNIGWFGATSTLKTITVTTAGTTATVPWVTNMTQALAGTTITNAGLVVSGVNPEYNATVAAGRIFSQTPGGGTVVARGSSVALACSLGPQPQLVLNNSFETNTASWTLTGSAVRSTAAHAGSGVASLRINTTTGSATQRVAIVSGKTYDISVYAYISARTAGQVVFDTGDKYDGTGQGQFVFNAANGGWTKYSGSFTATNTFLTVRMFSEGFAGTAYFDLIELKPRN